MRKWKAGARGAMQQVIFLAWFPPPDLGFTHLCNMDSGIHVIRRTIGTLFNGDVMHHADLLHHHLLPPVSSTPLHALHATTNSP